MTTFSAEDPVAVAVVTAVRTGDLPTLQRLMSEHSGLATARLADHEGASRTLLHIATDWPGHFPNCAATVAALVAAGADVNARLWGPHEETPLHWAASTDDVEALDALLDAGADIEAPGAVIAGGTPLTDARAFKQWAAARRLVERGANTSLTDAAALGLMDRVENFFAAIEPPPPDEINGAFWNACYASQQGAAEYLLSRGADINWVPPWQQLTPLDVAEGDKAAELARWLRERGAKSAADLTER